MKKLNRSAELMWLFGVIFVALGVCLCKKADLGVSMIAAPAFIVYEAVNPLWSGFSVGVVEYLIQGVLLLILCIAVRRFYFRYLFAFAVAIIYGYVLNFWLSVFGSQPFESVALRYTMLIVGDAVTALGVACFFRTYLPLQVYELFVSELSERYHFKISATKWCFDLSCLAVSVLFAFVLFGGADSFNWATIGYTSFHSIGLGTIITTIINSPTITLCGKLLDKLFGYNPLFPLLYKTLDRNSKSKTEIAIKPNEPAPLE